MKRLHLILMSAIAVACGASAVAAQDKYPSKPVRVMVPFAAGSATDITIRIVGEQMRQQTGHGFLVENKPGAFGIIAIEEMVEVAARRLHAAGRQPWHQPADAAHLQGQVQDRLRQRRDDGDAARRYPADPCSHHRGLRAEDLRRVHRLRQGESWSGALRQRRRRQQQPLRHRGVRAVGRHQARAHPEQERRRRHHQRRVAWRRSVVLVNAASSAGLAQAGKISRAGSDRGPATAGVSGRADVQGARICHRQGAVVGTVCAFEGAARRAGAVRCIARWCRRSTPSRCKALSRSR